MKRMHLFGGKYSPRLAFICPRNKSCTQEAKNPLRKFRAIDKAKGEKQVRLQVRTPN